MRPAMSAIRTKQTFQPELRMSASGVKRTNLDFGSPSLSAFDPKRTFNPETSPATNSH